jgi:hypothetical protein
MTAEDIYDPGPRLKHAGTTRSVVWVPAWGTRDDGNGELPGRFCGLRHIQPSRGASMKAIGKVRFRVKPDMLFGATARVS